MDLSNILSRLDELLSKDLRTAAFAAKVEIFSLLRICKPILGPPAIEQWLTKIGLSMGLTPQETHLLDADLPANLALLGAKQELPKVEPLPYPLDGFFGRYLDFTMNNEAPAPFHFWTAVSIIGSVLGRNVFFDKAHYKVYPNHFIVLVAPTGRCRKSTAISIGVRLMRTVESVNVIAEKITPEALVSALARKKTIIDAAKAVNQNCSGFIHAPELAVFLGKQIYNEGMVALLTGLSDNPDKWEYETKNKATVRLTNVNISMLGASTPDWLYDSIPQAAFGGGFMSRILFVVQTATDRVLPFPPPEDSDSRLWLAARLLQYSETKGQCVLSDSGDRWYRDWYSSLGARKLSSDDPRLAGYFERKPDHLLRLAMILAVALESSLELTEGVFTKALELLDSLELPMPDAFASFGETVFGSNARRVLQQIASAGGKMETTMLAQKNYRFMNKRDIALCIDTLREAGLVTEVSLQGVRYYALLRQDGQSYK